MCGPTPVTRRTAAEYRTLGLVPIYLKPNPRGAALYVDALWREPPSAIDWQAPCSLDAAGFRLRGEELEADGYRRVWHHHYSVAGEDRHAAILPVP